MHSEITYLHFRDLFSIIFSVFNVVYGKKTKLKETMFWNLSYKKVFVFSKTQKAKIFPIIRLCAQIFCIVYKAKYVYLFFQYIATPDPYFSPPKKIKIGTFYKCIAFEGWIFMA